MDRILWLQHFTTLYNDITNILNAYDLAHPFDDKVCNDEVVEVHDDTHVSFSDNVDVSDDTPVVDFVHIAEVVGFGNNIQVGVVDVGNYIQVNVNESITPQEKIYEIKYSRSLLRT